VIHVRAVSPQDVTKRLTESLVSNPGVLNLIVLEGAARSPDGDAVQFDVITAEANRVLRALRDLEVDRRGSIIVENVDAEISARAAAAEGQQPRALNFAPIWEEAEARIRAGGTYPPSWFALLAIAAVIGVVGILTNSQILIVGAMVVGPEYAAIISVALAVNKSDRLAVRQGLVALVVGFSIAIAVSLVFSLVIRGFDLQPRAFSLGIRPVSDLIDTPNAFSVVVAVLAGIVGVISLTEARTSTLLGVFISVTTIPAAADIGLSSAYGSWSEARGSVFQLLLNVGLLLAVGIVGLVLQRRLWQRVAARRSSDENTRSR
jgi:uncharacterized hydrophobic protein (TIGR00271 family)